MMKRLRLNKRVIRREHRQSIAVQMTLVVTALHAALLITLWWFPARTPPRGNLWLLLWASAQRPSFYPLVGVLLVGIPLSILAMRTRGPHRFWLGLSWATLIVILVQHFPDRIVGMFRVLQLLYL